MEPFIDPNDAPWTVEYHESYGRKLDPNYDDHCRYWCDENEEEYLDSLYGVI